MLENKKVNMILSLIIAIGLWAFVIGEVNPEATRVYREIPVQLVNQQVLDESGLAVFSVSDATMSVTVSGTRSEVNQIKEKDIVARVDLGEAAIGVNQLRVDVRVPSKVEIESQSINKVTVTVEHKTTSQVPVQVVYQGSFATEAEPVTIEQDVEMVSVAGAESSVAKVSHVEAIVEEGMVTEEPQTFTCNLVPMDGNGMQVNNVELSHSSIEITAELVKKTTVPLYVPIIDGEDVNIDRKVTVPETITLKGKNSDLASIEQIEAEAIDISNIAENTTLEIKPILPENVEVSVDSKNLFATVQVTNLASKTFDYTSDDIQLANLGENLECQVKTKAVQVKISGSAEIVEALTKGNITLTAELDGLAAGQHTVVLQAVTNVNGVATQLAPKAVKVTIKETQVQGQPEGETPEAEPEQEQNQNQEQETDTDTETEQEENSEE